MTPLVMFSSVASPVVPVIWSSRSSPSFAPCRDAPYVSATSWSPPIRTCQG